MDIRSKAHCYRRVLLRDTCRIPLSSDCLPARIVVHKGWAYATTPSGHPLIRERGPLTWRGDAPGAASHKRRRTLRIRDSCSVPGSCNSCCFLWYSFKKEEFSFLFFKCDFGHFAPVRRCLSCCCCFFYFPAEKSADRKNNKWSGGKETQRKRERCLFYLPSCLSTPC